MFRYLCGVAALAACCVVGAAQTPNLQSQSQADLIPFHGNASATKVTVLVKNQGTAASGATKLLVKVYSTTGQLIAQGTAPIPALRPSMMASVSLNFPSAALQKGNRVVVTVDAGNLVHESQEGNNTRGFVIGYGGF